MESWINEWIKQYLQGLSSAEYHFQITLLFLFLCFIFYRIYKTHHRYRFINDTPTSKIASAAQGYVELKGLGEMMPGLTTKSPFSGRSCLWYQCKVEIRKKTGGYKIWSEQSTELSDELFHLHDDTAVCVVIPEGADVIPSEEIYWYGSHYQAKYQGRLKSWWFNRYIGFGKYRFTEKLITVADSLYVIGLFKSVAKNSESETLRKEVNSLVDSWKKQPEKYLKSFDFDNNGKIQKNEWHKIRQYAVHKIRKRKQKFFYNTLQKPKEKNQPFIISTVSERQLLKIKYRNLTLYLLVFFLVLPIFIIALKVH